MFVHCIRLQGAAKSPKVACHFLSNRLEFQRKISQTY